MKKLIAAFVLASTLSFSQSIDLEQKAATDSIDLQALVAKQMAAAIERQLEEKLNPGTEVKQIAIEPNTIKKVDEREKEKIIQAEASPFLSSLLAIPWQYKAFALFSVVILFFVFTRRIVLSFTRKSKKALKKKIGMMREEKVGGSKSNPKLAKTRMSLKDNLEMLKQNDRQVSKKAKQLNISKGELLLAARLKLYEVGR